jgi:regulator of sigma E protease
MSIVLFVLVLLVLVVGHEFGHFVLAKLVKMKVLEFGIGFPPKIWGRKIGETEYTINWLPFGGFVKIFGESEKETGPDAMSSRAKFSQALVIAAGPLSNVVIGFLIFSLAFMIGVPALAGDGPVRDVHLVVGEVLAGSPAEKAGIKVGDRILSFNTPEAITDAVAHTSGSMSVLIYQDRQEKELSLTPVTGLVASEPERKVIGVATELIGTKQYGFFGALAAAAIATIQNLRYIVVSLAGLVAAALTLSADLSGIAGPVGIATLTGSAAAFGLGSLLTFAAMLSLNLAIVNLLPFPALDGGRLLFIAIEAVVRRKIPHSFATRTNAAGFALLILLMLVVTFHDIARLVGA